MSESVDIGSEEGSQYEYIQETMHKVLDRSGANLRSYLESEDFRGNLAVSITDHYKMELLLKKFPDKREQILSLIPLGEDSHNTQDSWSTAYQREKERNSLIESAPWDLGELDEFNKEVRHLARIEAEELTQIAKREVENSQHEGLVLVVSLNSQDMMKVIQDGQYKASLDNPDLGYKNFGALSKKKIQEQATITREELFDPARGYSSGLGPLEKRYLRELQMGVYPIGGDEASVSHPIYGQMIVNQDVGFSHAKEAGYGNLHLKLKTEKIKNRTTFFTGDSINNWGGYQLGWDDAVKARGILDNLEGNSKVDWRFLTPYIEAHIMGGVSIEDIDGCVFESSGETRELEDYFSANPEKFEVLRDEGVLVSVKFK